LGIIRGSSCLLSFVQAAAVGSASPMRRWI
jgi:hypothetical protein